MAARVSDVAYGEWRSLTSVAAAHSIRASWRLLNAQAIEHRLHRLDARYIGAHLMVAAALPGAELKTVAGIVVTAASCCLSCSGASSIRCRSRINITLRSR